MLNYFRCLLDALLTTDDTINYVNNHNNKRDAIYVTSIDFLLISDFVTTSSYFLVGVENVFEVFVSVLHLERLLIKQKRLSYDELL